MTDFQENTPRDASVGGRCEARVEAAPAPRALGGVDPEMIDFGLKLAFGVALFQFSLAATVFGQFTRG
jgi:hypothetical protein